MDWNFFSEHTSRFSLERSLHFCGLSTYEHDLGGVNAYYADLSHGNSWNLTLNLFVCCNQISGIFFSLWGVEAILINSSNHPSFQKWTIFLGGVPGPWIVMDELTANTQSVFLKTYIKSVWKMDIKFEIYTKNWVGESVLRILMGRFLHILPIAGPCRRISRYAFARPVVGLSLNFIMLSN